MYDDTMFHNTIYHYISTHCSKEHKYQIPRLLYVIPPHSAHHDYHSHHQPRISDVFRHGITDSSSVLHTVQHRVMAT